MKRTNVCGGVILATVIASVVGGKVGAQELATDGAQLSTEWMSRFYTSSLVNVGAFPGTLVQLSCATDGNADSKTHHEKARQAYGFVVSGDDIMHQLLPGTDEVRRALSTAGLQGTHVIVQGKYYPSTGTILVSDIEVRTVPANEVSEGSNQRVRLARCSGGASQVQ
jgi:hypothetical protein